MTKAKKMALVKAVVPTVWEGGDGAEFTVKAVKGGYQVLRDGKPTNIRGKPLPMFGDEEEARFALMLYGSIDLVLYQTDRIVDYANKIEETLSEPRRCLPSNDTSYELQSEDLETVLDILSTTWAYFHDISQS